MRQQKTIIALHFALFAGSGAFVHADDAINFVPPASATKQEIKQPEATGVAQPAKGGQQQAQGKLPPLPPPDLSAPAPTVLEMAKQKQSPLTPDDLKELRKFIDSTKRAIRQSPTEGVKPRMSSVNVDLSPGATPPIVRIAPFHGSTLTFIDATGAPWPIEKAFNFADKDFKIDQPKEGSESVTVAALGDYGYANISVFLKGLATPVVLTIACGGQKEMDYRVDLHIPRRGPNAVPGQASKTQPDIEPEMLDLLDGTPPNSAVRLKTDSQDVSAWQIGNFLFVRTAAMLQSPAYQKKASSADGTNVYRITPIPVVLVSVDGELRNVSIEGIKP